VHSLQHEIPVETLVIKSRLGTFGCSLTLRDFRHLSEIDPLEFVRDFMDEDSSSEPNSFSDSNHDGDSCPISDLTENSSSKMAKFENLINQETWWVVSKVCSECNENRCVKILKQFIKIAREFSNMFEKCYVSMLCFQNTVASTKITTRCLPYWAVWTNLPYDDYEQHGKNCLVDIKKFDSLATK